MSTKNLTMISMSVALITICSWISIKLPLISFTMQTFAVFISLEMLGGKNALYTILIYITLGILGFPVFSNFTSGTAVIFGLTGGYILGFIFQAIIYIIFTKILGYGNVIRIIAMLLGLFVCYIFGTLWFVNIYSQNIGYISIISAMYKCVLPFIIPDLCKMYLALIISKRIKKAISL